MIMKKIFGKRFFATLAAMLMLMSMLVPVQAAEGLHTESFDFSSKPSKLEYTGTTANVTVADGVLKATGGSVGAILKFDGYAQLKGVVEIQFDLSLNAPADISSAITHADFIRTRAGSTDATRISYLHNVDETTNNVYFGHYNESTQGSKVDGEETVILGDVTETKTIKLVLDFYEETYTGYCSGESVGTKKLLNGATYIDRIQFNFPAGTTIIDNLSITQTKAEPPTLASSSVADGETNVKIKNAIELTFSEAMDTTTFSGIKLYKGDSKTGSVVDAEVKAISDTICSIKASADLAAESLYTVVIPNSLVSMRGGIMEKTELAFATQPADAPFHKMESFNHIPVTGTTTAEKTWNIVKYIKNNSWSGNDFNYTFGSTNIGSSNYATQLTDANVLDIVDGKLKWLASTDSNKTLKFHFDGNSDGITVIEFDMELPEVFTSYIQNFIEVKATSNIFSMSVSGTTLYAGVSKWNEQTVTSSFGKGTHHFKIAVDMGSGTAVINVDDAAAINLTFSTEKALDRIFFNLKSPGYNNGSDSSLIYLDNVSVTKLAVPEVSSVNVADGDSNVEINKHFEVKFNTPVTAESAANISLTKNGEAVAATGTLDVTGLKYTLKPSVPLEKETVYTLTVPVVTGADGLASATASSYSFTTAATAPDILISEYSITDASGIDIAAVTAGETVKVSADFVNTVAESEEQNAALIIALYDSSKSLKEVAISDAKLAEGEPESVSASFKVPSDIGEGAYIKIFAWDTVTSLKPYQSEVIFPWVD